MLMISSALALVCLVGSSVPATKDLSTLSTNLTFEFLAEDNVYYESFEDISDSDRFEATSANCTSSLSTQEGSEPDRIKISCGFDLQDAAEGRQAHLLLSLDLNQIPADGSTLPTEAIDIYYQETNAKQTLFLGKVADVGIWIDAAKPAHEFAADVAILFHDRQKMAGSRVLIRGHLTAQAQPTGTQPDSVSYHNQSNCYETCEQQCYQECDHTCNINDSTCRTDCYSDCRIDCANQCKPTEPDPPYNPGYEDEGGCGGSAEDSAGCGEVWVDSCDVMLDCSASSYPEDDYDDTGCESSDSDWDNDDSGCESSDSDWDSDDSSCEGDTSSSDSCEGDAYAATRHKQRVRAAPLRALMRFFPEFVAFVFIHTWRRRHRRG